MIFLTKTEEHRRENNPIFGSLESIKFWNIYKFIIEQRWKIHTVNAWQRDETRETNMKMEEEIKYTWRTEEDTIFE